MQATQPSRPGRQGRQQRSPSSPGDSMAAFAPSRRLIAVLCSLSFGPTAWAQSPPSDATAETRLPEVKVREQAERADGPVTGYRATRSTTFTRTDTPLKEVPASVSVVPATVMKDAAM